MQTIIKIFAPIMALLEESPSGKIDLHWREKLEEEIGELRSARLKNDILGALTEAADVAYYATKGLAAGDIAPSAAVKFVMDETAGMNLGLSDVVRACVAKYKLRFAANKLGVGKNDLAERRAVAAVLLPRLEARMGTMDPLGSVDEQTAWDAAMDQRDALRETLRADA